MEAEAETRKSTRVPVDLNVRCVLVNGTVLDGRVLDVSTSGLLIVTTDPIAIGERLSTEVLLPGISTILRLKGEVVWRRSYENGSGENNPPHVAGIKFINLRERYSRLIRDYIVQVLCTESTVHARGILQIMSDIRKLPPQERLKAYHNLIK